MFVFTFKSNILHQAYILLIKEFLFILLVSWLVRCDEYMILNLP